MSNDSHAGQPGQPPPQWGQDAGLGESPPAGLHAANVGKRVGALIVDSLVIFIVITVVLAIVGVSTQGYLGRILTAAAAVAYFAVMEASMGQTIAKRLFGIKAVAADGSPLTMQAAVLRRLPFYIGYIVPTGLGVLIVFALVLAILITTIQDEPAHRGLHDKFADTKVIDA